MTLNHTYQPFHSRHDERPRYRSGLCFRVWGYATEFLLTIQPKIKCNIKVNFFSETLRPCLIFATFLTLLFQHFSLLF